MKIELYTDGACRGNGTASNPISGIGCVLLIPGQEPIYLKQKLDFEPNTNNKAEIYAIIQGINLIHKNFKFGFDFVPDELVIYSDSAYTINGITNWINGWRANGWITASKTPVKNKELWVTLDNMLQVLNSQCKVKFIKVKGHNGDKWNEKCDQLANEAMNNK